MKKVFIIVLIIVFISISIITFLIVSNNNTQVSKKIIAYCNKQEDNTFELKISDYTNFDWDKMIIYITPTSRKDLLEFSGIDYKNSLDLKARMIFVKDKQIVYEEYFETDFESPYKFIIHPYKDSSNKINQFAKEKAIFNVERIKWENENRYSLTPIE